MNEEKPLLPATAPSHTERQMPIQMPIQQTATAGKNATQVGGNMTTRSTTNFVLIPIVIGVLAMGGLAWAFSVFNKGGQTPGLPSPPAVQQSQK